MVLCNMPQRRQREAQDSDSIPCALICLFVFLVTWSALAIYICIWPSIKWVLGLGDGSPPGYHEWRESMDGQNIWNSN